MVPEPASREILSQYTSASYAERTMAVPRLFTVSLALFSASSVLITSLCSALISTPMNCAAWLRADSSADPLPSSSEEAPSFAPEKKSASEVLGALVSQAGGLGEELVFTAAGVEGPQAASAIAPTSRILPRTSALPSGLLGQPLRVGLQSLGVVHLAQHVPVVGQGVRLVDHVVGLVVIACIFVSQTQIPVGLGHLWGLELDVLLGALHCLVEGVLRLLPLAALGPADAAFQLRDVAVLLEVGVHEFLVRHDRLHEAVHHRRARRALKRVAVDGLRPPRDASVGVVALLLVGLGDDQPPGGNVDDFEVGADVELALQDVQRLLHLLVVRVALVARGLAEVLRHVAEDHRAGGH